MNDRRKFLRIFFVLVLFGTMSLLALLSRSTLSDIRAVEIVHLIGSGMCFGAAIMALGAYLMGRKGEQER